MLQQTVRELQHQAERHDRRFPALEDMWCSTKVKVRGVRKDILAKELPHLLRRLFQTLLPQRQGKIVGLEGFFHVPEASRVPAAAPMDLVVRFQNMKEKATVMAATKDHTPYEFDSMSLIFFQDLSGSTLAWQKLLLPFTFLLR
ncbi:Hypothetical predicted protein [Pelobates cultripes]|uniref:Uncharacterized protein n=1 Tax=Pelobates cultripes TaxID=61616 RepID=A0AAD1S6K3_PELCU|nr:Hypothetical predicted protein [Pelobates cultripes]